MVARPRRRGMTEELCIRASCHFVPFLVLCRMFAWLLVPKENQSVEYSNIKLIPLSAQVARPVFTGNRDQCLRKNGGGGWKGRDRV